MSLTIFFPANKHKKLYEKLKSAGKCYYCGLCFDSFFSGTIKLAIHNLYVICQEKKT